MCGASAISAAATWRESMPPRRSIVSPSLHEPFGLGVLEAARCRRGAGAVGHPDLPRALERRGAVLRTARPGRSRRRRQPADRRCGPARVAWRLRLAGGRRATASPARRAACIRAYVSAAAAARSGRLMRIAWFTHSLVSDWNHGNAHFLRGVLAELIAPRTSGGRLGAGGWLEPHQPARAGARSRGGLRAAVPDAGLAQLCRHPRPATGRSTAPTWSSSTNGPRPRSFAPSARGAPGAGASRCSSTTPTTGRSRRRTRWRAYDLSAYDGVLAFGEALREVYLRMGWGRRVWTWHEAADTRIFRPRPRYRPGRRHRLDRQLGRRRAQRRAARRS